MSFIATPSAHVFHCYTQCACLTLLRPVRMSFIATPSAHVFHCYAQCACLSFVVIPIARLYTRCLNRNQITNCNHLNLRLLLRWYYRSISPKNPATFEGLRPAFELALKQGCVFCRKFKLEEGVVDLATWMVNCFVVLFSSLHQLRKSETEHYRFLCTHRRGRIRRHKIFLRCQCV
jgi:hypothetical protein